MPKKKWFTADEVCERWGRNNAELLDFVKNEGLALYNDSFNHIPPEWIDLEDAPSRDFISVRDKKPRFVSLWRRYKLSSCIFKGKEVLEFEEKHNLLKWPDKNVPNYQLEKILDAMAEALLYAVMHKAEKKKRLKKDEIKDFLQREKLWTNENDFRKILKRIPSEYRYGQGQSRKYKTGFER